LPHSSILFVLLLAPTLAQFVAITFQHYAVGLAARIIVHLLVPITVVAWLTGKTFWQSFIEPIVPDSPPAWRWSLQVGLLCGVAGAGIIIVAFIGLQQVLALEAILASLLQSFRVRREVYLAVALAIIVVNPFLEEYFWRGFIFRWLTARAASPRAQRVFLILTGLFFALHHTLIIRGWFNWWQFILSTFFLALAGMLFNWMYQRSGSIIASWITHALADLAIVGIGFYLFGFWS